MVVRANLSVTDLRRAARHSVDYATIVEHSRHGELNLHISNLSANGFMVDGTTQLQRGDRIIIRLPIIGRIEGCVIWTRDMRAGLQFERIIRLEDFLAIVKQLQRNRRVRHVR